MADEIKQGEFIDLDEYQGLEIQGRAYEKYDDYLIIQASKLQLEPEMVKHFAGILRQSLPARIREFKIIETGTRVLCLGARLGEEVEAFIEQGAVAIGVDLNPGPNNKYVVAGDFHNLQFASGSFDVVFTNCVDHMLSPKTVLAEVKRVLRPGGIFWAEMNNGSEDTPPRFADSWDCLRWKTVRAPIAMIEQQGLRPMQALSINQPWPGQSVLFKHEQTRAFI